MNDLFKNFMTLSAKQIKTYAALILMSALTFNASAKTSETGENMAYEMEAGFIETEELSLESWMVSPFELDLEEGTSAETLTVSATELAAETELTYETELTFETELAFESELVFESWMAMPFEVDVTEAMPQESSMCIPAP